MARWDSTKQKVVCFPDRPVPAYPGWTLVDCGCCGGLRWGGESPEECDTCGGSGHYFRHTASRRLAVWPGGPFIGSEPAI